MANTNPHAVVIEWGDGTVDVNGPYATKDGAIAGARQIAKDLASDEDRSWRSTDEGAVVYTRFPESTDEESAENDDNRIDVYIRTMGTPVR